MFSDILSAAAEIKYVRNMEEYQVASSSLVPGDTIILANGVWKDSELILKGYGTAQRPIVLRAETPGSVFLEGQSNLRIGGEYLIVKGLVFRNGYTPSNEVISFSIDSKNLAFNSRVTECVIDNYNNPDRNSQDSWVMLYGQNNRFDHNHLEGKRNVGVTMAVRLNSEKSQENHHLIDHNYFGPRPVLGSNGGETLRVGTSTYSLTNSYTRIENNFFDKCNGETEIISIKSGQNKIIGNVFYESKGSLTLRHGNGNVVERNIFFGNGVQETGGVRVINEGQIVRYNYFYELKGKEFRAGISVMNGVPNSPINRYHQVKQANISFNTLINLDAVEFAVGSDKERTAVPLESSFSNNLFFNDQKTDVFRVYDDISGITFSNNLSNFKSGQIKTGFQISKISLEKAQNGLLYPKDQSIKAGAPRDLKVIEMAETGPSWYPKNSKEIVFGSSETITVSPGLNTLSDALKTAKGGSVLQLGEGKFEQTKVLAIDFPVSIVSNGQAELSFEGTHLIEIKEGGSLFLKGLVVTGEKAADAAGNAVVKINRAGTLQNYKLKVSDSHFKDMTVNHSFNFLEASKGSFADTVEIINSSFLNFTGTVLALDKETDDLGRYNTEYLIMKNNHFENIGEKVATVYRGGTDESTFGPYVIISNNKIKNAGKSNRNPEEASFLFHGVQWLYFNNNVLAFSAPINVRETVGKPYILISDNRFESTPPVLRVKL